jgi:DNA topoisomerase-1
MKLVIVESPAKAKTIEKYLGKGYIVRASVGHIRDLPKSNKDAVDIANGFEPHYKIVEAKQHIIDELEKEAKKSDEVILATDPDREGEAIAWHLADTIGLKKPKRIVFHEITENAVQEALAHPRLIGQLVKAQEARRVLDRLFGYDLSGLIWKKVRYGLSAGRVQSPALRILMEREREIRAFVPEQYWVLSANVKTKTGWQEFAVVCAEEPRDNKEAERIHTAAQEKDWSVVSVSSNHKRAAPLVRRLPLRRCSRRPPRRLGFSPCPHDAYRTKAI